MMAKYDNTLCYTEADTLKSPHLCVWCQEVATILGAIAFTWAPK